MSSRTTLNDQMRRLDVESIASSSFNTYAGNCLLHTEKEKVAPPRRKSDKVRYGVFDGQNRPAVMCLIRRMGDI